MNTAKPWTDGDFHNRRKVLAVELLVLVLLPTSICWDAFRFVDIVSMRRQALLPASTIHNIQNNAVMREAHPSIVGDKEDSKLFSVAIEPSKATPTPAPAPAPSSPITVPDAAVPAQRHIHDVPLYREEYMTSFLRLCNSNHESRIASVIPASRSAAICFRNKWWE